MTTTDPPPSAPGGADGRRPPLSRLVGRRPNQGAAVAAKTVIDDFQSLLRAEIALAKAEVTDGVKAKVLGAGFFIGVAVIGWLAVQVFLVFLGFLFALFLPGWAAVGLVLLLLLIAMGVLGFLGYKKLKAELNLRIAKDSVTDSRTAVKDAVDESKQHVKDGIGEAKVEVADALREVKARLDEKRDAITSGDTPTHLTNTPAHVSPDLSTAPQIPATTPAREGDAVVTPAPAAPTSPAVTPTSLAKSPATPPPAAEGQDR